MVTNKIRIIVNTKNWNITMQNHTRGVIYTYLEGLNCFCLEERETNNDKIEN